ncbi:MAG: GNAT family N-acetyltransferase [Thaumarchaeota archaeon]|nr:GNAT family N-acetyltransferase [Nitrososphaerota archaeon]
MFSFKARRYEPEDDPAIDALLMKSLPGYDGRERWSWMHKNGPLGFHGSEGDIWVAESADESLVGYYGRIRYSMRCFGRTVIASQGLNLATDSKFRKHGIATQLLGSSLRDAKKNGICLTFGFPNRLSYPLAIKQGGHDMGEAGELHLVLDREPYLNSRQIGPFRKTLRRTELALLGAGQSRHATERSSDRLEPMQGFAKDIDSIWISIRDKFDLGLERALPYLTWRYDRRWGDYRTVSLAKEDQTCGYIVTGTSIKRGLKVTTIYELLARGDESRTYETLIESAIEGSRSEGSTYMTVSASSSEGALRSLGRAGFRKVRWGARYVTFPYEECLRPRMECARAYQSLGDRDYL